MLATRLIALLDRPPSAVVIALAVALAAQVAFALGVNIATADPELFKLPSDRISRVAFTA